MECTNFERVRGDDVTINLAFKDDDGVAQDITGWTTFLTLKSDLALTDPNAEFQETVTSHDSPADGLTHFTIPDTDSDDLLGVYYYDMQYKDNTGLIKTFAKGTFTFIEDVTQRTS